MCLSVRLILLLALSLALRGFAGGVYAMPVSIDTTPSSVECSDHGAHDMKASHATTDNQHDNSCRISCDQAAAPALTACVPARLANTPSIQMPILPALAIGDMPPPDHPPPIR